MYCLGARLGCTPAGLLAARQETILPRLEARYPPKGALKRGVSIGTDEENKAVMDAKKLKLHDITGRQQATERLEEERFKYGTERDYRYKKLYEASRVKRREPPPRSDYANANSGNEHVAGPMVNAGRPPFCVPG
jgi:hypothetical protein